MAERTGGRRASENRRRPAEPDGPWQPRYNQPESRAIRIASIRLRAPVFLETAFR